MLPKETWPKGWIINCSCNKNSFLNYLSHGGWYRYKSSSSLASKPNIILPGLTPVLSHTEKSCIVSYERQLNFPRKLI